MASFRDVLDSHDADNIIKIYSKFYSKEDNEIEIVLRTLCSHKDLAPNIKGDALMTDKLILKWVSRYYKGKERRIFHKTSKLPGTVADPIINAIINARLTELEGADLEKIKFAHRLSMSAENILGFLLEEYILENIAHFGWCMCWGATIRSVDFCHTTGKLLQIKNRSNSENSSSSRVRIGTQIEKWYRVHAATGRYNWDKLNEICSSTNMSEDGFIDFVNRTIQSNPSALPVEDVNPWRH